MRICLIENCNKKHYAKEYCYGHWFRFHNTGNPLKLTAKERFFKKVKKLESGCWIWTGCIGQGGYAKVSCRQIEGGIKSINASRYCWFLHYDEWPGELHCCHKCDNPACVNIDHLFLGTPNDNKQDALKKGRVPRGEQLSTTKLSEEDIISIRKDKRIQKEIAADYDITQSNIGQIKRRCSWKHILGTSEDTPIDRYNNIGEKHPGAKLTENDVLKIRADDRKHTNIAKEYGITKSNVSAIKARKSWNHI